MKKLMAFLAAAIFAVLFAAPIFCLEVPPLTGPVMDTAGIMSAKSRAELEEFLLQVDQKSSAQIVVLTIPSLQGESLEEYAIKAAREWQLGRKEDSKGALLLVAYSERKIRIEVGYGAEGDLTDAKCGLIIRNIIAPAFKDGDYSRGIEKGARAMAGVLVPDLDGGQKLVTADDSVDPASAIALLIFFLLYFFMFTGSLSTKFRALRWLPWAALFIRKANGPRTGSQKFYDEYYGSNLRSTGFGGGFSSSGGGFSGRGGGFGGGGASGGW